MPRTQLHSAASGPARTAFHANRGVSVDELEVELAQASTVVTTAIDSAKSAIQKDVKQTETALTTRVNTAETAINNNIVAGRRVVVREVHQGPRPLPPPPERTTLMPDQQQQAFLCILAIDRAESLTIDTSRGAAQNNRTLRQIRNDRLVRSGLKTLPDVFQESVQAIHNNFPTSPEDEAKERLERFWMIQNLRRAIMAHFAAQSLVAPSSTTVADAPATQDTQS